MTPPPDPGGSPLPGSRPRAGRRWFKAHGLGNDYLVFEEGDDWLLSPAAVARVCHRQQGVGADGIVLRLADRGDGVDRLRMFNPDGGEFERSGNGLRIYGLWRARALGPWRGRLEVVVGGDRVALWLEEEGEDGEAAPGTAAPGVRNVGVHMGPVEFGPAAVGASPALAPDLSGLRAEIPAVREGERPLPFLVSVGNPHCVLWLDDPTALTRERIRRLGPALSRNRDLFPGGLNVQLAARTGPARIRILIWERGVGPTTASGTSACASAAAAVRAGALEPGTVEVEMEGGSFFVTVDRAYDVALQGPVEEVTEGELTEAFAASLGGSNS